MIVMHFCITIYLEDKDSSHDHFDRHRPRASHVP